MIVQLAAARDQVSSEVRQRVRRPDAGNLPDAAENRKTEGPALSRGWPQRGTIHPARWFFSARDPFLMTGRKYFVQVPQPARKIARDIHHQDAVLARHGLIEMIKGKRGQA